MSNLTSEWQILNEQIDKQDALPTTVDFVLGDPPMLVNPLSPKTIGLYRAYSANRAVIADMDLLAGFEKKGLAVPAFLEAGPRDKLRFDPTTVHAAVVTTGGIAPGLHCVIHSIVNRHRNIYRMSDEGKMYGVYNSFSGLCDIENNLNEITTKDTEEWLDQGGSKLGIVRSPKNDDIVAKAKIIANNLKQHRINILYVIGGDGSMQMAHAISKEITGGGESCSVIGIPKTMDNDVLWVSQSFGFDTAVEQATKMINTLRSEAESTRRICIIELFGADSGFVAANASLASGHVDAVLIPEVFKTLTEDRAKAYLDDIIEHIADKVIERNDDRVKRNPHAVVVVAEGVGTMLKDSAVQDEGVGTTLKDSAAQDHTKEENWFVNCFKKRLEKRMQVALSREIKVFINQPRHYIRAKPADSHDQIFCERLGALAVDTALAGYTDCMVSEWLTEFVLVPLELVTRGKKSIHIEGIFWKQVVNSTGQPFESR